MAKFYDRSQSAAYRKPASPDELMADMIKRSSEAVFKITKGSFSRIEERVIVTQKLLDVVLKNYSPVAYTDGSLDKYANAHFLADQTLLDKYYSTHIYDRANDKAKADFRKRVAESYKKLTNQELPTVADRMEEKPTEREQIAVDLSALKVDEAKTEAPQTSEHKFEVTDPSKKRMVLKDLSETVGSADVSARVDKQDAPVISNSID